MITCFLSVLLFVITFMLVWILFMGIVTDSLKMFTISLCYLFFVGIMGWGIAGNGCQIIKLNRPVEVKLLYTDTSVVCLTKDNIPIKTITDIGFYKQHQEDKTVTMYESGWVSMYKTTNWTGVYSLTNINP